MKEKYKITVSEPWEFDEENGNNTISGTIIKVVDIGCIVFVSEKILKLGELKGNTLILSSRYKEDREFDELSSLTVNGGLLQTNYSESLDEGELKSNAKFVIIGRLEKYR